MIRVLFELTRIVAYGGGGVLLGFIVGRRANDDHALKTSILYASEAPVSDANPSKPKHRWANEDTLRYVLVIGLMVAMLGTGLTFLLNDRANRNQQQQLCTAVSSLTHTLNKRTDASREAAAINDDLWRGLRHLIVKLSPPDKKKNPVLPLIDVYLNKRRELVAEQKANPFDTVNLKDC